MHWMFLILASICEILWFYCIGYLNNISLKEITNNGILNNPNGWWILIALVGYAVLGILNMIFFSKSIQKIAPGVAFAVWTGVALAGITISDGLLGAIEISPIQIISICLILIGVIGLKFYAKQ